jgi:integrase/recombinase XerC
MDDTPHITAWLDHLTAVGHPATTRDTYRCVLTRASRELPHGLGQALPEELVTWLGTHRSLATRGAYRAALTSFYRWVCSTRRLKGPNPAADLPRIKRPRRLPRPVEHHELALILEDAAEPVRTWAVIAAYAGARCCEIARLDRADVSEQSTRLHGKGDRQRSVPTHPAVWAAVAGLPAGLVAAGRTPWQVSHAGASEFRRLGVAGGLHRLRHYFGTHVQAAVRDLRVTQELLGHASPATTAVYTAVSDSAMRAAVLALPHTQGDPGSQP